MFDTAIVGSGPAGVSAAINLALHNKSIVWFGAKELSEKLGKAEKIVNYPGLPMISGEELNRAFAAQVSELSITLTEKTVTNIMPTKSGFMLLADNDMFEAKSIILATGAAAAKGIPGEKEFLGSGVSYCATCDGFLYKGKTLAVYSASKRFEHEVRYLAELAGKLWLFPAYDGADTALPNTQILKSPIAKLSGGNKISSITLLDKTEIPVDGVFFLRNAIAPDSLIKGIELNGAHIAVSRDMRTSIPGVFAAGDCTGRPYQIAKAVGEGNVAAHSVLEYLADKI